MPLTEAGIYYADTSTNMSIADITAAMATSMAGALKVLQVVNATNGSLTVNSTSAFVDTGLTATITPSSTTSKILVLADQNGVMKSASNAGNWALLTLVRGTTSLQNSFGAWTGSALNLSVGTVSFNYLDSPASTSALTYKVRFANDFNGANVQVNYGGCVSGITLMEISA